MQFEIYVSTFQNDSSVIFCSCEASRLPVKQSSFASLSVSEDDDFLQSKVEDHIVILNEIEAGSTDVRGEIRTFKERRIAISIDKTKADLDNDSLTRICEYLKNLKTVDFGKLSTIEIPTNIDKLVVLKDSKDLNLEKSNIQSSKKWNKKVLLISLVVIGLVFPTICICANEKNKGLGFFFYFFDKCRKNNNESSSHKSKLNLFEKEPDFYKGLIDAFNLRKLDFEKCFEETYTEIPNLPFTNDEKTSIKYFIAFSLLDYIQRVYSTDSLQTEIDKIIDDSLLDLMFRNRESNKNISLKNNSDKNIKALSGEKKLSITREVNIYNEINKGMNYLKVIKDNENKFRKLEKILDHYGFSELNKSFYLNKNGETFDSLFNNKKKCFIYLFIPSTEEMKKIEGITYAYYFLKDNERCKSWDDFPKVFGYGKEEDINNRKRSCVKTNINLILRKFSEHLER